MAEAFAFRGKAVSPERTARSPFGRRTWLVVGLMTSAMLLMCASVALFQRRFDLASYFRRPPVAAAPADEDWGRNVSANGTKGKIHEELKREPRSDAHSTVAASEIKTREPLQTKTKRKARTKSASRQGAENGSMRTVTAVRKASTTRGAQRLRDGTTVVDIGQELELLQRPFAERPAATDEASPTINGGDRTDTKKELPVPRTAGTAPKYEARFVSSVGSKSAEASHRTQPSSGNITESPDSRKKNEESTPNHPPADLAISSTDSNHDSPAPHKGVRMVKRRRKLRKLITVPASTSSTNSLSSLAVPAGNVTGAGPHTDNTGEARAKEEVVIKKREHHDALNNQVNSVSKLATGLSSESPTTSMGRAAVIDVGSSKASGGNISSNSTTAQVYSSSPSVNTATLSTARDFAGILASKKPASSKGTVVGLIGSTASLAVADTASSSSKNKSSSRPESSSITTRSNNGTVTSASNKHTITIGTSNASLGEFVSSAKSSSQLQTSLSTRSPLLSTENTQTTRVDMTSADANLVDIVAEGVNKSAEDVLKKILDKATKEERNNSGKLPKGAAGMAETSGGVVVGRVTWANGGGDASSSVAEASAYSRPASQPAELTRVPSTSSIDQNQSKSTGVAEGRAFLSTRTTARHQSSTQSSTAAPSTTQLSTIQPSEEGFTTRMAAKEFAAKRQPMEGSPEGPNSAASTSLRTSTTTASTSEGIAEEVVVSTETSSTAPPDEIIPETEAPSSTSSPKETSSPETTTVTISYYTGQDEWIPEASGGYMNALGGYANKLKIRRRGKAPPAHATPAKKKAPAKEKEKTLSGDRSSHQTRRGAAASFASTIGEPKRPETRKRTSAEALPRVQQPAAKANVKAEMSDLYSSLNAAIQEESKHNLAQSNEEMLDYGVVPHDVPVSNVAAKNQHDSLRAQNASSVPRLGPDVRNGPRETGTVTPMEHRRGSVSITVATHPRNANRSAGWNRSTNANPGPFGINTADEGVQARTFETRSTNVKQGTSKIGVTLVVMNRNNEGKQSKRLNALPSTRHSLVAEFTTTSSPSPAAEILGKDSFSFSQTTSRETNRAHTGYAVSYTDKRKLERSSELPPNPLDIETDLPETESPNGRNKPDARPLADDYASAPTDGSTNSSATPRYVEISSDIKDGKSGKPHRHSPSGNLAEESMENADNTIPTRTPQATEATSVHSVMGIHEVETTARGIERKTRSSVPTVKRPGVVCVYRKNHAGWVTGNTSYGLESLPYEYCTSVVYCCLSMREDFAIEGLGNHNDFKQLAQIKNLNPGLETFVVIEANESTAPSFKRLISKTVHQDIFLLLAVHWMRTRVIDGAYLYWPQMKDKDGDRMVNAFRYLLDSFAKSNLKFGLILPAGTRYLAKTSALKALTDDLDGSYAAILLSPLEMDDSAFTGTLSSPTKALAEEYKKYPEDIVGTASVCPMIPFWGKTFKMQAVLQDTGLALRPVGRGGARQTSREPGKLAFFEFCRELGKSLFVFPSRENAVIGDEYVTFLTPASLEKDLSSTASRTSWRCFGSWGPEWDDFDGHCGMGRYPLLKTLYEFQVKHAVNVPAAFGEAGQS
nr:mucin-19-like [Dermacentor andersoni]